MKKRILLSVLALSGFLGLQAQSPKSQRMVLAEEFTNASCSPCASQNPAFDALLAANAAKITSIKYHTNWPGTDPMNAHNPQDVAGRVTYYSVSGVPYCRLDGVAVTGSSYSGAPSNLTQAKIDAAHALPSPYNIQLHQYIPASNDSVYLTLLIHATEDDAGSLVAHLAVIEKLMHYNSAPGSNGEKDFHNVMKKLLPGKNGVVLPSTIQAGDYFLFEYAWKFTNVLSPGQIGAVAFVQNNADKNVRQAANSSTTPITPVYQLDASIKAVENIPVNACSMFLSPIVTIRNNGSQPLTSLTITYNMNGETNQTYNWSGYLEPLQKASISLPQFSFLLQPMNTLSVTCSQPNGQADQYTKNDSYQLSFPQAPTVHRKLELSLKTDNFPLESSWQVLDELGNTVASSGVISQANTLTTVPIQITGGGCYTFVMNDAGGNGLCCSQGYGYFQLRDSTGTVIAEGDQFGYSSKHAFSVHSAAGIDTPAYLPGLSVYPNPANDFLHIGFSLTGKGMVNIELYNEVGTLVYQRQEKGLSAGQQEIEIPIASLAAGIYLLRLTAGDTVYQSKVAKAERVR